jgi:CRP-like cAMP-binding protein
MKEELKNYITKIHKIPDELLNQFLSYWHIKKGDKKEIITAIDSVERYLYFTVKGFQKAYYLKDDKEYNIAFTYPFAFTCVPESFLTQEPSKYSFECITESEFLRISHKEFFGFVEKQHEFETLLRKTLIGTLGGIVNRYHRILTLSMEERYKDFMKKNPQLINQIPHKEIANYLKMDPTNFSKLLNTVRI